jgi:DNA ligase 1
VSYTLKPVYDALVDIASDRSRLTKEAKIQKYLSIPYFEKVVLYAYDYNKKYNVTNISMQNHNYELNLEVLFQYLDFLSSKNGANDEEKINLSILASHDPETIDVINRVINKDLKCGASTNTFKKFIKTLPVFEIMTCQRNIQKFLKLAKGKSYYYSDKKDGVRVINMVYDNYVKSHLSRSGLEYPNFNYFDDELIILANELNKIYTFGHPIYIDGEAIAGGKQFNKVMTQIRRLKNVNVDKFKLYIFDSPSDLPFKERYEGLEQVFKTYSFKKLELVEHILCDYDKDTILDLSRHVLEHGVNGVDEGVVIKIADSPYVFKEKSKYWCKVKPTETLDLEVTGFYFGKPGTRLESVVGGLKVNYKGVEVHVGSGLSDIQRSEFLDELPEIIEVEYKEVTPDGSLREPIMKCVRDDKLTHD